MRLIDKLYNYKYKYKKLTAYVLREPFFQEDKDLISKLSTKLYEDINKRSKEQHISGRFEFHHLGMDYKNKHWTSEPNNFFFAAIKHKGCKDQKTTYYRTLEKMIEYVYTDEIIADMLDSEIELYPNFDNYFKLSDKIKEKYEHLYDAKDIGLF